MNLCTLIMDRLHHYLTRIYNKHKKKNYATFADLGLSHGQPKIIEYLYTLDGCAQKDLAKVCELQPATVTSLLQKMEKDGLIYRVSDKLDNGTYINRIYLTKSGKDKYAAIMDSITSVENLCFDNFSEEEKKQCIAYMKRIFFNLEKT